jgi:hypothetical protein
MMMMAPVMEQKQHNQLWSVTADGCSVRHMISFGFGLLGLKGAAPNPERQEKSRRRSMNMGGA